MSWIIIALVFDAAVAGDEGELMFRLGRYEEALKAFTARLTKQHHSVRTLTNIGCTLHRLGRDDEALHYLESALQLEATPAEKARIYYNIGNIHYRAGRRAEAIEAYKSALRLNHRDGLAKYNLEIALKQPPAQSPKSDSSSGGGSSEDSSSPPRQPKMSLSEAERILEAARQSERGPAFRGKKDDYFNTMIKRDW
ncbi:MAG: tetratricopeptide repeat protein [Acidobacteriota bacterium]|nr:tetratricopeptide repeat protein [Blastocatellia bacterium]MDW8412850.1 tetratricopeptide repeat protein [Acidobacteriota bacterium]